MKKDTIDFIRMSHPEDLRFSLDNIVNQLEKYGRAITPNGEAARVFAHLVKSYKDDERIFFGNHRSSKKSIIALSTSTKIEKIGNGKLKFSLDNGLKGIF